MQRDMIMGMLPARLKDRLRTGRARLQPGRLLAWPLVGLVAVYRYGISPLLGVNCRFEPSCSEYAREALLRHGAFRGGWLAARRVARCHPWGGSGHDPVPEARDDRDGH